MDISVNFVASSRTLQLHGLYTHSLLSSGGLLLTNSHVLSLSVLSLLCVSLELYVLENAVGQFFQHTHRHTYTHTDTCAHTCIHSVIGCQGSPTALGPLDLHVVCSLDPHSISPHSTCPVMVHSGFNHFLLLLLWKTGIPMESEFPCLFPQAGIFQLSQNLIYFNIYR